MPGRMRDEGSHYWSNTSIRLHIGAYPAWDWTKGGTASRSAAAVDWLHVGCVLKSARTGASWAPTSTLDFSRKFTNPTSKRGHTTFPRICSHPANSTWCIHVGYFSIWLIRNLRSIV